MRLSVKIISNTSKPKQNSTQYIILIATAPADMYMHSDVTYPYKWPTDRNTEEAVNTLIN